ncbi:TnsD family Tn7-like transposition protein [Cellulosilyticum sp. ST5]|uniref:TnsD family Tn7-like transposition protein n=1 Tax=Cellulosilyticum sp. ST5 TaxID=3055805 RepID=UPI003977E2B5
MSVLRPYTGEIFYSWVTRMYSLHTKTKTPYLIEMFGMTSIGIYKVKSFQDDTLQQLLPLEEIIQYQSIVPLLQLCMKREEYKDMIKNINSEMFAHYKWPQYAKVCPQCYQEEIHQYGEPYLHVEHQLPENLVCNKHGLDLVILEEGAVAGSHVSLVILLIKKIKETHIYNHSFYHEVSKMISKIFNEGVLEGIYLEEAQAKYESKLRYKGYYMHTLLDRQLLAKDIIEYFSHEVLDTVGASLKQGIGWIKSITQKQQKKLKLICHLIIIQFLFGSIEEFVKYDPLDYKPFGEGPWPCLNPFCRQYMQGSIEKVYIKNGRTGGRVIGTWECKECGFRYSRQGPDEKEKVE